MVIGELKQTGVKADYANKTQTNAINKSGLEKCKLRKDEKNKRNKGEVSSTKHGHIVFGARLGFLKGIQL